jgi:hypothetical protein
MRNGKPRNAYIILEKKTPKSDGRRNIDKKIMLK